MPNDGPRKFWHPVLPFVVPADAVVGCALHGFVPHWHCQDDGSSIGLVHTMRLPFRGLDIAFLHEAGYFNGHPCPSLVIKRFSHECSLIRRISRHPWKVHRAMEAAFPRRIGFLGVRKQKLHIRATRKGPILHAPHLFPGGSPSHVSTGPLPLHSFVIPVQGVEADSV